jgi:hypothetical protein
MIATASKTTRGKVTVKTILEGQAYEVTDTIAKATAIIGSAGRLGWYCTVTRYGRNWKHMVVSGTDNPHSVYEVCFQLGTKFEYDADRGEWRLPE